MPAFDIRISKALQKRRDEDLTRTLVPFHNANTALLEHNGHQYVNFSSNDYLGLASDPDLAKAWQKGLDLHGSGSGASPIVTGFSRAHFELEQSLCEWLGYERAILFSSGFSANQALLFSLMKKGDLLLQDRLNHASLMEAGSLCEANMKRFKHNDVQHLTSYFDDNEHTLVVTEGVFSMDGDQAPLQDIKQVCEGRAWLAVDDAHGIGVLGEEGRGSTCEQQIKPDVLVVTFGKAFGLSGAAILCSEQLGDYLMQFSRHHVYSTAIPPSQAYALQASLSFIQTQQWRRDKLIELQAIYQQKLHGLDGYVDTNTPIKPLVIGQTEAALACAERLRQQGFWATAIRPPTVQKGQSRIRLTLTANHTVKQVTQLCDAILQITESL
ncbi:8-amino-7-oxononanoate synthase [Vibrio sp. S4M6]|uniref:8-amino-7-oxononanoate synthase n=1 Tax=Vibrio sinus TaxID=2946865 RepID=UPI00202AA26C|nr:8-amino-7-oxononanoate synthase [Vibrio sinus]MCL9782335.1 8-amino-7-oxononanoate synthase [Vibrio sinus]